MSRGFRPCLSLLLVLTLLVTGPAAPLFARDKASTTAGVAHVAGQVRSKAGGWGLLTPLIVFGAKAVEAGYEDGHFDWSEAGSFVKSPTFWKGFAGDALFSWLAGTLAGMLPGGALIRNFVAISGGFLGWEVGTGNLAHTDWGNLFGQILAASAVQTGLGLLGFSMGGWAVSLAAAAAAIATGIFMDKLRKDEEGVEADAPRAPPVLDGPQAPEPFPGGTDPQVAARLHAERYRRLLETLRSDGVSDEVEEAWKKYRSAEGDRHELQEFLTTP